MSSWESEIPDLKRVERLEWFAISHERRYVNHHKETMDSFWFQITDFEISCNWRWFYTCSVIAIKAAQSFFFFLSRTRDNQGFSPRSVGGSGWSGFRSQAFWAMLRLKGILYRLSSDQSWAKWPVIRIEGGSEWNGTIWRRATPVSKNESV